MFNAPPPHTQLPGISVIICAYTPQRWADLNAVLSALERQHYPPQEVILVIDHNPALYDRARQAFPGVQVIENCEAPGLAGARNSGVHAAQGEIIAFTDDDALPEADWLEQLAQAYTDPEVAGAGGEILPLWPTERPGWFPPEFDWVVGCTYRGLPRKPAPVRNLIGCNMSFRREVLQAVGGFAASLGRTAQRPLGCEETELCIRIGQRLGPDRLLYLPQAVVYHRVSADRTRWTYFRQRCYAEGLSKAQVAARVGRGPGLSSERAYTLHTLPAGVKHALGAARQGDPAGLPRAGAIIAGLLVTAAGYGIGRLRYR
jgi:GT2 family glycosyltransferase